MRGSGGSEIINISIVFGFLFCYYTVTGASRFEWIYIYHLKRATKTTTKCRIYVIFEVKFMFYCWNVTNLAARASLYIFANKKIFGFCSSLDRLTFFCFVCLFGIILFEIICWIRYRYIDIYISIAGWQAEQNYK